MNRSRHFNMLMASALSFSLAATPMLGVGVAHAQNAPSAEAPGDAGWQKEFEVWRSASKAGTAADYASYLKSYPTGKFASVAKKRIDELNGTKTADTARIDKQQTADTAQADTTAVRSPDADEAEKKRDLEMWRQVSKTGKQADYEKYLKAFPKGKFAKVAKTRIDSLMAAAKAPADQQTADVVAKQPAEQDENQAQTDDQQNQADDNAKVTEQATTPDDQAQQQDQASSQDNAQQEEQAQAPASDWEQEYALWKAASAGNTVNEYEAYLKAYPKGKFTAIAQARIVQLAAAEQPVANVDEGDTAQTEQNNTVKPADDQNQMDQAQDQNRNDQGEQQDQADQGHMNQQPDDQNQVANNQPDDQSQQNDTGQNTQDQQAMRFTEGTPETEDQYLDRETRHEIQGRLTSLGYDTFGSDGSFGPNSRTAISNWQQDNGAPASGYLSGDQIAQIRKLSQVSYAQWLNAQQVVVQRPVIVRPRREKIIVEERRNPGLDAAIAVGVLGAVVGAQKFGKFGKFNRNRPGKVKVIGKFKMNKFNFNGCKKKRRC